jgi:mRNA-degrading endonuclease toxin of MazEF toxin-antitoxin module
VVAMTPNPAAADYSFGITSADLEQGSLKRPSRVRVDKIYTLSQALATKTFGRVNAEVMKRIRATLRALTARRS